MLCKKKKVVGLFLRLGFFFHQNQDFVLAWNLAPSPFVAQACSGAIKLAVDSSIHLLGVFFSVWLDIFASSRNSIKPSIFHDFLQIGSREAIDRIGFLRNATRSRQTEINTLSKCIELHCEFIASESMGALSSAVTTIGFCWKTAQFGSREPIWLDFSATRYDLGKRRKMHVANVLNFMLASS